MRGAGARAWGAGWKDDLTRAIAVEIPGLGVKPVSGPVPNPWPALGKHGQVAPQAAIAWRRNGYLEWGVTGNGQTGYRLCGDSASRPGGPPAEPLFTLGSGGLAVLAIAAAGGPQDQPAPQDQEAHRGQ
jgi:hypothetical protein